MGPFEFLKKIVDVFEHLQVPYLVTGAVASIAYGEPRLPLLFSPSGKRRLQPNPAT
jgi:hypothetical protein